VIRLLFGILLLPTSTFILLAGVRELAGGATAPFWAGMAASLALWWQDSRAVRRLYVFGHEATHALAAWGMGGKVHAFRVGDDGGHVDLSESNFIIALAPYCVPIYVLVVVALYRFWLWWAPAAAAPGLFLALMGAALAFHWALTAEVLWTRVQPDLAAAGGRIFSLSLIALSNGLCVLLLSKALFPGTVDLGRAASRVYDGSRTFWSWSAAAYQRAAR
jgi:hypothetical protein